jgi:hypothetical protein
LRESVNRLAERARAEADDSMRFRTIPTRVYVAQVVGRQGCLRAR